MTVSMATAEPATPMAIPTEARASAGVSFTPSPTWGIGCGVRNYGLGIEVQVPTQLCCGAQQEPIVSLGDLLSIDLGTYKTVRARSWAWLEPFSGKTFEVAPLVLGKGGGGGGTMPTHAFLGAQHTPPPWTIGSARSRFRWSILSSGRSPAHTWSHPQNVSTSSFKT